MKTFVIFGEKYLEDDRIKTGKYLHRSFFKDNWI